MRRAVLALGGTVAGLAALFSYKSHVPAVAAASTRACHGSARQRDADRPRRREPPGEPVTVQVRREEGHAEAASPAKTTPPATHSAAPASHADADSTPDHRRRRRRARPPPARRAPSPDPTENTQYGQVQVTITVSDGKITNANGSLPQGGDSIGAERHLSAEPGSRSTAQSANIQAVSGATYTSQGYIDSLQEAVDQAGLLLPGATPRPPHKSCGVLPQPPRRRVKPGGITRSSGVSSAIDEWPRPSRQASMPERSRSRTFSTPACPLAPRPHR